MAHRGYLSAAAVEAALQRLASTYPSICQVVTLPEPSIEGRTIHALRIGGGNGDDRPGLLVLAGVHAREIVNPDLVVSFALRICQAYTARSGLSFGGKRYPAEDVRTVLDGLDLFCVPLVNPDGRVWVQSPAGDPMWRKNRNPNPGRACMGVDINRNYDFLWPSGIGTSTDACSEVFKGERAFSEPETRNVRHLLDEYPHIECMVDVHSYSELILYPWGDDDNQTTDPAQNFANPAFDGQRGVVGSGYREYIPEPDLDWYVDTGTKVRDAIAAVRGRSYTVQQGVGLYPTSATSDDYAYSRHFVDAGRRVYAYVFETAREFQPPQPEGAQVIEEGSAGLVELCLACVTTLRASHVADAGNR
ncbi:MAG: M14 family metallopeptidase [Actinomycetota bacterium]|nr:M14 family metallopeptidase [Actinomycetota bacterium]